MQNILTELLTRPRVNAPTFVLSYSQRRYEPLIARLGRVTVRESYPRKTSVGPVGGSSFRRSAMATSPTIATVEFCDAFNETLCKLKALELLLNTQQIHEALEDDAVSGIAYLFSDVINQFEALNNSVHA